MEITRKRHKGSRLYEIVISRKEFDDLCADCPESGGVLFGRDYDTEFFIQNGITTSDSWNFRNGSYWFSVGASVPVPEPGASFDEWNAAANEFYENIEQAIASSGILPMETYPLTSDDKPINVGYVQLQVELK